MNYNVTFYRDLNHLLTERKANFTHQLAKFSSKIFNALGAKLKGQGTSAQKILKAIVEQIESDRRGRGVGDLHLSVSVPDFINHQIYKDSKPNPIKINAYFYNSSTNTGKQTKFEVSGATYTSVVEGKLYVGRIDVKVRCVINPETVDYQRDAELLVDEFNSTLVHEIAHAKDDLLAKEHSTYSKTPNSRSDDLRYINYFIKPTEIRSHLNEVIRHTKRSRFSNPQKSARSFYKKIDNSETMSPQGRNFAKDSIRTLYKNSMKNKANETVDSNSKKYLMRKIDSSFRNSCSDNMKKFIVDYHIAFVRDNSEIEKQRYYNILFPNSNPPSIDQMRQFYDAITTVYRTFTRLENDHKKSSRIGWSYSDNYYEEVRDLQHWKDFVWDEEQFKNCFETYNPKLLKKIAKQAIEDKRSQLGLITKGMMTKAAQKNKR